jgi:hypothetical protein
MPTVRPASAQQVALAELAIGRDAVHHLVVDRGADGVLIAVVADESGNTIARPDEAVRLAVQIEQGDARPGQRLQLG